MLRRKRFSALIVLVLGACQGCILAEHPLGLVVQNNSSATVTVQVTGFREPWKSKPILPGSQERVEAGDVVANRLRVKFFDSKTGKLLLDEPHPFENSIVGASTPDEVLNFPP